jgi:hypothetical protein
MSKSCWAATLVTLVAFPAVAKDPCVSGPQVGEKPGPYSFLVAIGPQRGQPTCYVCETADKPGVIVFARSVTEPLGKLIGMCDDAVTARPKDEMRAWMTVLGEKTIALDELGKWAKQLGLKAIPVGVFDDAVGPPSYKLSDDADVTVVLFVNRKVVSNFAFRAGELNEDAIKRVAEAIGKLVPAK